MRKSVAFGFFGIGGGYCPEALAYFARMVVEASANQKNALDKAIIDLKDSLWWDDLDAIYFVNQKTQQQSNLNLKGSVYDLLVINSLGWTEKVGYKRLLATTQYLNTQFVETENTRFGNEGKYLTFYSNFEDLNITTYHTYSAGTSNIWAHRGYAGGRAGGTFNSVTFNQTNSVVTTSMGFNSAYRIDTTHIKFYNSALGEITPTASAVHTGFKVDAPIRLLNWQYLSGNAFGIGKYRSNVSDLKTIVDTYISKAGNF